MDASGFNWEFIKAQLPTGWQELAVEMGLIRPQPPQLHTKIDNIEPILRLELQRVGTAGAGPKALELLDLSNPDMNFVAMAQGMGLPASTATTCEELADQFSKALKEPGPHLIEALVPSAL